MHPARSGDRNVVGGDRHLPDRGLGFLRRGDRYTTDRWNVSGEVVIPPPTGLNDGDPVTTWKDSSNNGHDATQTGSARPIFKTGIVGGKPVVRFASASSQALMLASTISSTAPLTFFVVMKPATPSSTLITLASVTGNGAGTLFAGVEYSTTNLFTINNTGSALSLSGFHIFCNEHITGSSASMFVDGTLLTNGASAGVSDPYTQIGQNSGFYSDGDIAEILVYSGTLAVRAKLLLVLTVLLTTGEIPSPDEAEALLTSGDLVALEAYLIEHGVSVEQARDTLEPMAAGDRANIEKYLGTKYGLTVTSGGTAVDPSTVAGLVGWWKADSLAAATGPPPFDPTTIAGLKGWWKADAITTSGLREALAARALEAAQRPGEEPLPEPKAGPEPQIANGDPVGSWPDSSGNGKTFLSSFGSPPTYVAAGVNGKPVVHFPGDGFHVLDVSAINVNQPNTIVAVARKPNVATTGRIVDGNTANREVLDVAATSGVFTIGNNTSSLADSINHQGNFHIFTGIFNGATSLGFVDGIGTITGVLDPGTVDNIRLQCDAVGGSISEYDLAELLIYNSALSTTDRQNVEAYLKAKYGL